jgi:hypothetical protein
MMIILEDQKAGNWTWKKDIKWTEMMEMKLGESMDDIIAAIYFIHVTSKIYSIELVNSISRDI